MKRITFFSSLICLILSSNVYGQIKIEATKASITKQELNQINEFIQNNSDYTFNDLGQQIQSEGKTKTPIKLGNEIIQNYSIYTLNDLSQKLPSEGDTEISVKLGNEFQWDLELTDNNSLVSLDHEYSSSIQLYKSKDPENKTRLAIYDGIIEGLIEKNGKLVSINSLSNIIPNEKKKVFVYEMNNEDLTKDLSLLKAESNINTLSSADFTNTARVLKITTDVDYEFYCNNGSNAISINNSIISSLNQAEGVFYSNFKIRFVITNQHVWTYKDNFTEVYPVNGSQPKLDYLKFRGYWGNDTALRDHVMLFTGKRIGSVSDPVIGQAYGDTWSGNVSFSVVERNQVSLLCHEIVHTFQFVTNHIDSPNNIMTSGAITSLTFLGQTINEIKNHISQWDCPANQKIPILTHISGATNPVKVGDLFKMEVFPKSSDVSYKWQIGSEFHVSNFTTNSVTLKINGGSGPTISCYAEKDLGNGIKARTNTVYFGFYVLSTGYNILNVDNHSFQILQIDNALIVNEVENQNEFVGIDSNKFISYKINNMLTGMLVDQGKVINGSNIDTSKLSKGIYLLVLNNDLTEETYKISIK